MRIRMSAKIAALVFVFFVLTVSGFAQQANKVASTASTKVKAKVERKTLTRAQEKTEHAAKVAEIKKAHEEKVAAMKPVVEKRVESVKARKEARLEKIQENRKIAAEKKLAHKANKKPSKATADVKK